MTPLAIALALFVQSAEPAAPAAPPEDRLPAGAPKDDYQFVAWCYGALRGYLDLHDQLMPEVTRIEGEFRKPGTSLADDLKVYADMQKDGQQKLKLFQGALTAAEKASVRPINVAGAQAVRQGRMTWSAPAGTSKARMAQEWMSWALPARCERVAASLEARAKLMGASLKANQPSEPAPSATDTPAEEAKPTDAPAPPADNTPPPNPSH
jgi:hypothetical protein